MSDVVGADSSALAALQARVQALEARLAAEQSKAPKDARKDIVCIVCFSGEWDRLFAAFTIANGALALGQEVHMFFTFWGATAIRKQSVWCRAKRNFFQNLMGTMLPGSIADAPLSKFHFWGLGKWIMGLLMKQKGVDDLPSLMKHAHELGAKFHCCDTSLELFGWKPDDLVDGTADNWCGVSTFLSIALKGKVTLFI